MGQNSSAGACERPQAQPGLVMGTGSARARLTPSGITAGRGDHVQGEGMLLRDRGSGYLPCHRRACTGAALELLCPLHPAPRPAPAAEGLSIQQGHGRHQSGWAWHPLAPRTEQTPAAKPPRASPSPANPRPSSSKHPTWKQQHHHGHNQSPATSTQGKGQPQTPQNQPWGARNGAKLAPGPPACPTATGNPGWALPPATRPRPRSRHGQGNKKSLRQKVVPVLSALFFSSKDTKEFKHRA